LLFLSTFVGDLKGMLSMMKPISPIYINVKGRLLDLATPQVMGILNVTPDSFSGDGVMHEEALRRAKQLLDDVQRRLLAGELSNAEQHLAKGQLLAAVNARSSAELALLRAQTELLAARPATVARPRRSR
jgi:hypothetical protein